MIRLILSAAILVAGAAWLTTAAAVGPLLVTNGTFDGDVAGWERLTISGENSLTFAANADVNNSISSGGAELRIGEGPFSPGGSFTEAATQCIEVDGGEIYEAQAAIRIPAANQYQDTTGLLSLFWYGNQVCTGGSIGNSASDSVEVGNDWQLLTRRATVPLDAQALRFRVELTGQDPDGPAQSYAYIDHASLFLPTPGDADCSKTPDAIDAAVILQLNAGLLNALLCHANADVNDNGAFNSIDAALILQFSAGLIGTLPP